MDLWGAPLVKRYGDVLAQVCQKKTLAQRLLQDWKTLEPLFQEDVKVWRFVASPLLTSSQKQAVFESLFEKLSLSDVMQRFLKVLIQNQRLHLLQDIMRYWTGQMESQGGAMNVRVTTAVPINVSEKNALKKELTTVFNDKKIRISSKVDSKLLGGFILSWRQKRFDASVATRLKRLSQQLQLES